MEQLRIHPFYRTIPVIICSTSVSDDDRQKCYLAGANAFVTKPHQFADLIELVRCLLTVWI
uniref:response regulator n=1 Tax=Spirosoma sp. SC4-14 TaxID=3128900 RepID=UPI00403F81CD